MNTGIKNHPRGLWALAIGNGFDTFSYFGTQTILALYLIHVFHFSRNLSYLLYGAYATFTYILPIVGGVIADRWLGSRGAIFWGCALNVIGNAIMISLQLPLFCLGLAFSLFGSGLYKSNSMHLAGSLYTSNYLNKESGFTLIYLAMNVGGALAPVAYGFIAYHYGWNYIFLLNVFGMLLSLIILFYFWQSWKSVIENCGSLKLTQSIISISVIIFLLAACFYYIKMLNLLILMLFVISIIYLLIMIFKQNKAIKRHLLALFILCGFALFYFSAGLQIGTTITLFIQQKIHQGFIHTNLPASIFSMLYCFFVLLLAPFFALLWKRLNRMNKIINPVNKVTLGISLAAFGIALFALASITNWLMLGILLGILFLSAGELVLTPTIYTLISNKSPDHLKSTMMGCWYLCIALGGYLGSVLATSSHWVADHVEFNHNPFSTEFIFISGFTFSIALILLLVTPKLRTLLDH